MYLIFLSIFLSSCRSYTNRRSPKTLDSLISFTNVNSDYKYYKDRLETLIKHKSQNTDINAAILSGDLKEVVSLLENESIVSSTKQESSILGMAIEILTKGYFNINSKIANKAEENSVEDRVLIALYLIQKGSSLNFVDESGDHLLDMLVKKNSFAFWPIIRSLILRELREGTQIKDNLNKTLLHSAIKYPDHEIFDLLLSEEFKGFVDINFVDSIQHSALHSAVEIGDCYVVRRLLESGANVDVVDSSGKTPLNFVKDPSIASILLEFGADINSEDHEGLTPICWICEKPGMVSKTISLAILFAEKGADLNVGASKGRSPLQAAVLRESKKLVLELIKLGANPNIKTKEGKTLLHNFHKKHPVKSNYNYKEKLFFAPKKDYSSSINLIRQILNGKIEVSKTTDYSDSDDLYEEPEKETSLWEILVGEGLDLNSKDLKGRTPLHDAVLNENLKLVREFIRLGGDINAEDNNGQSAMHFLVKEFDEKTGYQEIFDDLIRAGINLDAIDNDGNTALNIAISNHRFKFATRLIELYVDIRNIDKNGRTLIHSIPEVFDGSEESNTILNILIERGLDINAQDYKGRTALHRSLLSFKAYTMGRFIRRAVEMGADINIQDHNGRSPIFYAKNQELAELLIELGSNIKVKDNMGRGLLHFSAIKYPNTMFEFYTSIGLEVSDLDNKSLNPCEFASHYGIRKDVLHDLELIMVQLTRVKLIRLPKKLTSLSLLSLLKEEDVEKRRVNSFIFLSDEYLINTGFKNTIDGIDIVKLMLGSPSIVEGIFKVGDTSYKKVREMIVTFFNGDEYNFLFSNQFLDYVYKSKVIALKETVLELSKIFSDEEDN